MMMVGWGRELELELVDVWVVFELELGGGLEHMWQSQLVSGFFLGLGLLR